VQTTSPHPPLTNTHKHKHARVGVCVDDPEAEGCAERRQEREHKQSQGEDFEQGYEEQHGETRVGEGQSEARGKAVGGGGGWLSTVAATGFWALAMFGATLGPSFLLLFVLCPPSLLCLSPSVTSPSCLLGSMRRRASHSVPVIAATTLIVVVIWSPLVLAGLFLVWKSRQVSRHHAPLLPAPTPLLLLPSTNASHASCILSCRRGAGLVVVARRRVGMVVVARHRSRGPASNLDHAS
jgi:hypothetical protein